MICCIVQPCFVSESPVRRLKPSASKCGQYFRGWTCKALIWMWTSLHLLVVDPWLVFSVRLLCFFVPLDVFLDVSLWTTFSKRYMGKSWQWQNTKTCFCKPLKNKKKVSHLSCVSSEVLLLLWWYASAYKFSLLKVEHADEPKYYDHWPQTDDLLIHCWDF